MAAATAYCTSNTNFHQHSLTPSRSPFTSISRRTTLSPSTSFSCSPAILHNEELQPLVIKTSESDENNNHHHHQQINDTSPSDIDDVLYIATDEDNNINPVDNNDIDEEQFLSYVGLRPKNKKSIVRNLTVPPLTKRYAYPVCLLPLPKFMKRVRQALYIGTSGLKHLSITTNIEPFCLTDESAKVQSLLPRSTAHRRSLPTVHKSPRKQRLSKSEFIRVAANTLRYSTNRSLISKHVDSTLRCNVLLDRLEQSTIDQIMANSSEDNDDIINKISAYNRSLRQISLKTRRTSSISDHETTITNMTTEKIVVKRKTTMNTTTSDRGKSKRFKAGDNNPIVINDHIIKHDLQSSPYERIYLKCFVCSKRQYIDGKAIDSAVLHSHWLEHDGNLSLNIYDAEINSILTRVVEFFKLPKQHMLEGKIRTVFICNSQEIRSTSTNNLSSDDPLIVID